MSTNMILEEMQAKVNAGGMDLLDSLNSIYNSFWDPSSFSFVQSHGQNSSDSIQPQQSQLAPTATQQRLSASSPSTSHNQSTPLALTQSALSSIQTPRLQKPSTPLSSRQSSFSPSPPIPRSQIAPQGSQQQNRQILQNSPFVNQSRGPVQQSVKNTVGKPPSFNEHKRTEKFALKDSNHPGVKIESTSNLYKRREEKPEKLHRGTHFHFFILNHSFIHVYAITYLV